MSRKQMNRKQWDMLFLFFPTLILGQSLLRRDTGCLRFQF
jgi:hypothetical protein